MFCAGNRATEWRKIWNGWTYSETIEFSVQLIKHRQERDAHLQDIKDPMTMLVALMMNQR